MQENKKQIKNKKPMGTNLSKQQKNPGSKLLDKKEI